MPQALVLVIAAGLWIGCGPEGEGDDAGSGMGAARAGGGERARLLGPFLDEHWRLPLAPQGPAPQGWSELEASLDPAHCGACHPEQHAQWSSSLHAAAFSPGFAGQIVEGPISRPSEVRLCQTCHTPLAEQLPLDASGEANPVFDAELRAQGLVCAGCHVRRHRRYGPPRRADAPAIAEPRPHGGFEVRAEYQEARFCAPCHQFFDTAGVNGKPVQNTFLEWQASPHAEQGRTCQSCHMPDRAHLWRGIHDPEMVRAAVDVELVLSEGDGAAIEAALVLHSREVGHAFPTYTTPRVLLEVWQVDERGVELAGSRVEHVIGRKIDFASRPRREVFDTRVAAGGSARLAYDRPREPGAGALVGRVTVDPDHHYRGVFEQLRKSVRSDSARARIEEAHRQASQSRYVLAEIRRALPPGSGS